ncbi:hypothetical protein QWY31_14915 [Cytophagales bacterium LB-30]|uniref:Ligand-binding SRPBCC domain-containing protein n=1 Tax=Shiella aurantiaca TaxID=3058365 RepID=A0ABT8F8K4_9BACT|nr:hypothetical protein [Shiella aurantiaca]MDN4166801.1 hypothetical protein [Shiella aurantiaca]
MQISISTVVDASLSDCIHGFTEDLFLKLNPPFPPVKILRFDGCQGGDWVKLELNFLLFRQEWHSYIPHHTQSEQHFEFVDEGKVLPFFLKHWQHRHRLEKSENDTTITDAIHFSSGFVLFDVLLYPVLYLQFLYRKPIYKKHFRRAS